MRNRRKQGEEYEAKVAEYLKKKKYQILDTNYHTRGGEIDIIAKKGDILCFVEVKARDIKTGLNPLEAVDGRKQKKIISAAKVYIHKNELFKNYIRFDVAGVTQNGDKIEIEYVKDAFIEED